MSNVHLGEDGAVYSTDPHSVQVPPARNKIGDVTAMPSATVTHDPDFWEDLARKAF